MKFAAAITLLALVILAALVVGWAASVGLFDDVGGVACETPPPTIVIDC